MSGPAGHEREPDQAALDELERAFAGEDPSETAPRPAGAGSPEQADGGGPTRPVDSAADGSDRAAGDVDLPDHADDDGALSDVADDDGVLDGLGDGDLDDVADDDGALSDVADDDGVLGGLGDGDLDDVADDDGALSDVADADGADSAPGDVHVLDDLGDTGDAVDRAVSGELLIGEAEQVGAPTPPTPTIIRIDDYGGSAPIEDLPADDAHVGRDASTTSGPAPDQSLDDGEPIVIEIDDGDLPDAVYVEGSLERSGSGSIVFIEDDDTGDTLAPEAERDIRRGIEPRLRERRVAVKRARGRKRLKWVVLAAVVVLLVVGTLAVLGSGWFAIQEDQVVVTGNVYTDPELLQDVIDDLVGTPVLLADTQGAERDLEEIPWVDTARVRTDFPHGVTVEIRERKAISTYRGPDLQFRVLDREGRVLDVIEKYPIAYVLLDGPDPVDLDAGEFAPRGYAAASELAKNLTGSVRGRVVRIEVTSDGSSLVMFLDDDVQVRFGEARDLFAKLVRLETVFSSGGVGDSTVIDVSTSEVTL